MKAYLLFPVWIIIFSFSFIFSQNITVKIIETSDVHGAIFPYNLKDNKEINSSLARVSDYINKQRADTNQVVFLLDNGDILQGNPAVYYYNYEKTDTINLYADVMNYLKYDAATVGNHDIETGHPVYDKFNKEINFPWLAANAINTENNQPYFKPYTTIERGGVKIAVLGLITPAIPQWLPEKIWSGIRFDDMIETAKKWVKIIRETEQPDLMIGLFHSGVDYTYNNENENTHKNENAARLVAEKVDGFDLIFVGHDHEGWNFNTKAPSGKEVLILGTTANAQNIAVASYKLKYDKMCMVYDKKEISGELVSMKDYSIDANFINHFSKNLEAVRKYISTPVGDFTEMISSRESLFGPSKFVDLIQAIQLEITGADISFTAPLSYNTKIDAGKIDVREMFDLYRYENFLYTMELSGQEIKDYLEFSYGKWMNTMNDENGHLLKFKLDDNGNLVYSERSKSPELEERYYNFDSAAGIDYVVDVSKPVGERIHITGFSDGRPFEINKKYKVAVNSYRGNGGGRHLTEGAKIPFDELSKRVINSTEKDLRFFVMRWIENQKTVTPKLLNNWKVIPENFWQAGKQKDYKLLFN